MKCYVGRRERMTREDWRRNGWPSHAAGALADTSDTFEPRVCVREGEYERPLRHYNRHSPSGFEWGYGGSGPADLAFAILIDYFELEAGGARFEELHDPTTGRAATLPVSYQQFKADVVAKLPREEFVLPEGAVRAWVATQAVPA